MLDPFMKELAESRAETLREDWGQRSPRSVRRRRRVRRALGMRVVAVGERLKGDCLDAPVMRMGGHP